MVGFDIPFAFVSAGAITWRYGGHQTEYALLFAGAGVAVPGLAFLEKFPDWDLQYFIDSAHLPDTASAIFAAIVLFVGFLGAKCGAKHPKVIALVAALLALFCLVTLPRTLHVGTRSEYLAGTAPTLGTDFLFFAAPWFVWSSLVLAFCLYRLEMNRFRLNGNGDVSSN